MDYNLHKSNSTYFTDSDIARCQLVTWLGMNGIRIVAAEMNAANGTTGPVGIHLGGVMCNFKREIKPFEKYEIWTRMLTWDKKWFYVVNHWVKKGSANPRAYTMQPWKNNGRRQAKESRTDGGQETNGAKGASKDGQQHPAIFATAIAKYVGKKGRLTVPPERILQASGFLPPKPEEPLDNQTSATPSPDPQAPASGAEGCTTLSDMVPSPTLSRITSKEAAEAVLEAALISNDDQEAWDWNRVEEERLKGLQLAQMYNGLEALGGTFDGDGEVVLGSYTDIL